jgi:excinuclease UvrABC ATPase subunit
MICEKCGGTGKIKVERPASMTRIETIDVDCDICNGTGQLAEDLTPIIVERLDRIIKLLEKLAGGL